MKNIQVTDQIENEPLRGREVYVARLVNRDSVRNTSPAPAEPLGIDGEPLRGYDLYRHRLSHPKAKTAGNGKGAR